MYFFGIKSNKEDDEDNILNCVHALGSNTLSIYIKHVLFSFSISKILQILLIQNSLLFTKQGIFDDNYIF